MAHSTIPREVPRSRGPFTVAELDRMPDDGRRHEIVDGMLIVTPAPGLAHQRMSGELFLRLREAAPPGFEVLFAPYDVRFSDDTNLEPDLLVARTRDLTERNLPVAPLLAVEVRSPSTALLDRTFKRAVYQRYATLAYWLVDPDPEDPSITAFVLGDDGRYDDGTLISGAQEYRTDVPFPISLRPADLIRR